MKGLIIRCVGLNEDVREGGGVRGQDERGVQKQAHGEEHDAFAPKAEEEKGERAEQVGPDIEEQGGADGRPGKKGTPKKRPVRVLEAMASKRLFPGGRLPRRLLGSFPVLALALPDGERQARKRAPDHAYAEGSGKAVGKTGERVQDAHRTADENAAEKKMSHDIPVSNDL